MVYTWVTISVISHLLGWTSKSRHANLSDEVTIKSELSDLAETQVENLRLFRGKTRWIDVENNCWASTCSTKKTCVHKIPQFYPKNPGPWCPNFGPIAQWLEFTGRLKPYEVVGLSETNSCRSKGLENEIPNGIKLHFWPEVAVDSIFVWKEKALEMMLLATLVFKFALEDEQDLIWLVGADDDSPENHWQDVQAKSDEPWRRHEEGIWQDKARYVIWIVGVKKLSKHNFQWHQCFLKIRIVFFQSYIKLKKIFDKCW